MAHIVKLTVADRNNILKYAYNLPSTLGTYFNFDAFAGIVGFSEEEEKELDIKYVDGEIQCNCPDRTFDIDIEAIPEPIMDAIRTRVEDYESEMKKLRDANKANPDYQDSPLFTAIVENLSKLLA